MSGSHGVIAYAFIFMPLVGAYISHVHFKCYAFPGNQTYDWHCWCHALLFELQECFKGDVKLVQ